MSMSTKIRKAFERITKLDYGAKYHKVDFHFHTPGSSDARANKKYGFEYPKPLYRPAKSKDRHSWASADGLHEAQRERLVEARRLADDIIDTFVEKGLSMVAVTDHNSLATIWPLPTSTTMDLAAPTWYELLDEAAEYRRDQKQPSVVILPGVEVTIAGVHVLGVFPPTEPRRQAHLVISSLLTEVGIEIDKFGVNAVMGMISPSTIIDIIHRRRGVAIIAHVDDSKNALFKLYEVGSTELSGVLASPQLHAIEVLHPKRREKVPDKLKKKGKSLGQWISDIRDDAKLPGLAFFQGSDAHSIHQIGDRWSYLMMSTPSFAGLTDALQSPSSRVRISDLVDDPPTEAFYVYGFEVDHPAFGPIRARLNRNLNCIIGGTGAGKTLLLELLRGVVTDEGKHEETVMLFVEHHTASEVRHYCFTRSETGIVPYELTRGSNDKITAKPVAADAPAYHGLRPRIYDTERMRELIASHEQVHDFLVRYFGPPEQSTIDEFNDEFDLPRFPSTESCPLLDLGLDGDGRFTLQINTNWRRKKPAKLQAFDECTTSLRRLIIMIMVLVSGQSGPVIIDEPADEFDNADISHYLVPLVKLLKGKGQVILATKNANLAVNADPENYVVLERATKDKVKVKSGFAIDDEKLRKQLIELLEGDLASFERRRALYVPPSESTM